MDDDASCSCFVDLEPCTMTQMENCWEGWTTKLYVNRAQVEHDDERGFEQSTFTDVNVYEEQVCYDFVALPWGRGRGRPTG